MHSWWCHNWYNWKKWLPSQLYSLVLHTIEPPINKYNSNTMISLYLNELVGHCSIGLGITSWLNKTDMSNVLLLSSQCSVIGGAGEVLSLTHSSQSTSFLSLSKTTPGQPCIIPSSLNTQQYLPWSRIWLPFIALCPTYTVQHSLCLLL